MFRLQMSTASFQAVIHHRLQTNNMALLAIVDTLLHIGRHLMVHNFPLAILFEQMLKLILRTKGSCYRSIPHAHSINY